MPNAYTWQFDSFDVYPTYNALTNVVQSIHWRITANDGAGHFAQAYGEEHIDPPDPGSFIPYADLTLGIVQGWLETILGDTVNDIKRWLDERIANQSNPETVSLAPPW